MRNKLLTGIVGALLGAGAGYLMRPSAPLVGQLPFDAVITRGGSLEGLDQVLVPLAQRSFNYLLIGLIVGFLVGLVVGHLLLPRQREPA